MAAARGDRQPFDDQAAWYASLPSFTASGAALIWNTKGEVMVVKPWYRDAWGLPGGVAEAGESPRQCAEREVAEETGLKLTAGGLLAIHWMPPADVRRAALHFVFDFGVTAEPGSIRLQAEELDDFTFAPLERAMSLLAPWTARRLAAAWRARAEGRPAYLEGLG